MAHIENGDKRYIRKEYIEVENLGKEEDTYANGKRAGAQDDAASVVDTDWSDRKQED